MFEVFLLWLRPWMELTTKVSKALFFIQQSTSRPLQPWEASQLLGREGIKGFSAVRTSFRAELGADPECGLAAER